MEEWRLEFKWLEARHFVKDALKQEQLPDLNTVLLLIGIQELGQIKTDYTKEEKQDLMHIAVCRLLSEDGFYHFTGIDADGWPHWEQVKKIPVTGVEEQERLLKIRVIAYFENLKRGIQIDD